jgi:aryl-alcohol dehydrogenase-like predicted oxidoreductase
VTAGAGSGTEYDWRPLLRKTFEGILGLAFEQGVNLLDTSENYGMGNAKKILEGPDLVSLAKES